MRLNEMFRRFSNRALLVAFPLVSLIFVVPVLRTFGQAEAKEWVAAQKGHVFYKHKYNYDRECFEIPFVPVVLVSTFGVDFFNPITGVAFDCNELEDFLPLTKMPALNSIYVNIELADGIDFSPLVEMRKLKKIHFTKWSFLTLEQFNELRRILPNVVVISEVHGAENSE